VSTRSWSERIAQGEPLRALLPQSVDFGYIQEEPLAQEAPMVSSIRLFAVYNASTNEKIHQLLLALGPEAYTQERKTFFSSIQALHLHLIQTTKNLQSFVRANFGGQYFVSPLTEEAFEVKPQTLEDAVQLLAAYDAQLVAFSAQWTGSDATHPKKKRTLRNGSMVLVSISDLLTHYMVHTAHHRGQLSQILDEIGVDHDIGSLWAFTEPFRE